MINAQIDEYKLLLYIPISFELLDLVHNNVAGRMEQKGGARHRSSSSSSKNILPPVAGIRLNGSFRIGIDIESARILLRKHEFHESVPKDHLIVLQDRSIVRGNNLALVQGRTLQQRQDAFP